MTVLERIRHAWKQAKDDAVLRVVKRYPINILEDQRWELDCRICGNLWFAEYGELKWVAMVIAHHFSPHVEELA